MAQIVIKLSNSSHLVNPRTGGLDPVKTAGISGHTARHVGETGDSNQGTHILGH